MPQPWTPTAPALPDAPEVGFAVSPWVARRLGVRPAAVPAPCWWMGTPGAVPSTALVPATRAPTALAGLPTPGAGAPARAPAEPHGAGLGRAVRHLRFRRVLVATGAGRYGGVLLSAGTELLVLASRGSRIRFIALDHVVWIGGA